MKEVEVRIMHAFSRNGMGGNPAGIVLEADDLTQEEKQLVAAKLNISEVAYVSASEVADFKLEFFTPTRQIAHCGHATIATFSYLKSIGTISGDQSSKETIDGIRRIFFRDSHTFMQQQAPTLQPIPDQFPRIARALGLSPLTDRALPPAVVNTGNAMLVVPVASSEILSSLRPDHEAIAEISRALEVIGFYPFAIEDGGPFHSRMFAPSYGIPEETATGMGAGTLGAYLFHHGLIDSQEIDIIQGESMPPPSPGWIKVVLNVESDILTSVFAGGDAHAVSRTVVYLP